jgi:hypothetical protein
MMGMTAQRVDTHLADHPAGGRLVNAPGPSAVVGLRDAQTGDARATRVRQLATPSWLSTRLKPVIRRRAAPARETVARTALSTLELATAAGSSRFFSLALRAGAAMARDDVAAVYTALAAVVRACEA